MFVVLYIVNFYIFVFMTCSTSCGFYDTNGSMECKAYVNVCMYMYVCVCVCVCVNEYSV